MIRHSGYRVDVIRGGAIWGGLRCTAPPRIDMNADAAITRSLSLTCAAGPDVRWLTDSLRPVLYLDGEPHSLGVFYPVSCREQVTETGEVLMNVEAYDRAYLLSQSRTETRLHFAAGTGYLAAVDSLLIASGISLRQIIPTSAVLQTAREDWDIGTSRLDIVNQLLSEINYTNLWFDGTGWARSSPMVTPSAVNSQHTYGGPGREMRKIRRSATRETDSFGVANVFIVICDNPDYPLPMQAVSVNDSPLSALSTLQLGKRIVQVVKVDNIASASSLQTYADNLRMQSIMRGQVVEFESPLYPDHGCRDVVTLNHPEYGGIWQERGWTMTLGVDGTMTHRVERVALV